MPDDIREKIVEAIHNNQTNVSIDISSDAYNNHLLMSKLIIDMYAIVSSLTSNKFIIDISQTN